MFTDAAFGDMDLHKSNSGHVDSLSELENDSFSKTNDIEQAYYGVGIDLDDFVDAQNPTAPTSVTGLEYGSSTSATSDPTYITALPAVPEPATAGLLLLGGLGVLARRRRR